MKNYNTPLTDEQNSIIKKAIELLAPYDKEQWGGLLYSYYNEKLHEDFDREFDSCNDDACIAATKKKIRKQFGNFTKIGISDCSSGDSERITRCNICDKPLTEHLAWIEQEFKHHQEYSITKEDLTESSIAYDIKVIFESFPSLDYKIDQDGLTILADFPGNTKRLNDAIQRRNDFIAEVVAYAQKVIDILKPTDESNKLQKS